MTKIGTIISYCTNDFRFIGKCIEEAKKFSSQIVVAVCDHFFDGTPENRHLLEHTYALHPDCLFIEFSFYPDRIYSKYHKIEPHHPEWPFFWAATTRYVGFYYLDSSIDSILFLDSDEIIDSKAFLSWLKTKEHLSFEALRFGAYLYALRPNFRAKKAVNLPLFVQKKTFSPLSLMNLMERIGAYIRHGGKKREEVVGIDGLPFVHHYSWVRTKEECLWKAKTWGHRNDEDWKEIIEKSFQKGADKFFASPHEFEEISEIFFDPFQVDFPKKNPEKIHGNVLKISDRDLFLKEIESLF